MGEIVNLKRVKKCRARARDTALAQQNRVRFGRTGAEKLCDQRAEAAREALLDGKRREAHRGWVAQGPEFAACDCVGQGRGVAAEHVDVLEAERGQAGRVRVAHVEALGAEPVQRRIHVDRVPEHDDVDR